MPLPDPLSAPVQRRPIHTRRIAFEGFLRDDGLWDIECSLVDTKGEDIQMNDKGLLKAGEPVHDMRICVTLDDDLKIHAIRSTSPSTPFPECLHATGDPMQKLVGMTMGPGWRKKIEGAIGGTGGCTHMRELIFNAATAAFQTIPGYKARKARVPGAPRPIPSKPPFYMGQCMAWALDGPVVQRHAPHFYRAPGEVKKDV